MQWWLSYDQVSETNLPTIECKHSIFDKQFISNEFETIDIRKEKKGKKKGKKVCFIESDTVISPDSLNRIEWGMFRVHSSNVPEKYDTVAPKEESWINGETLN